MFWGADADDNESSTDTTDYGSDLVLRQLTTGNEMVFKNVLEYYFSKAGDRILIELSANPKDPNSKPAVIYYEMARSHTDT
jgi:hypothetical protein